MNEDEKVGLMVLGGMSTLLFGLLGVIVLFARFVPGCAH